MYRIGSNNPQALMGAWQDIVGWQNSGEPTNLQHGPYGGHRARQFQANFAGYGGPAWGPRYGGAWGFGPGNFPAPMPMQVPMMQPQMAWPYEIPPRNILTDRPGPTRADRIILPMSSGVNILPNTSAQITSRPQQVAFRGERMIIADAESWIINDIKIGNQSQFSQSGDVPGALFAATTVDGFVKFETCQCSMDFVVVTTFVGASESGAPFVCGVLGTAAVG